MSCTDYFSVCSAAAAAVGFLDLIAIPLISVETVEKQINNIERKKAR